MNKGEKVVLDKTETVLKTEEAFTESHLELPLSVRVFNALSDQNSLEEVRELIWEYALTK